MTLTSLSFFEDYPPFLVELQTRHWSPLLDWAREEFKADIRIFRSLMSSSQPLKTQEIFRRVLNAMDAWQLACKSQCNHCRGIANATYTATERAIYASKSLIVALALVRGRISVEEAALASQVEVASQIQKWGEVEDCKWFIPWSLNVRLPSNYQT